MVKFTTPKRGSLVVTASSKGAPGVAPSPSGTFTTRKTHARSLTASEPAHASPSPWRLEWLIAAHFMLVSALSRCGWQHVVVDGLMLATLAWGTAGRRFMVAMLPVWIVAVLYGDILPEALRLRGSIHIADLYEYELIWFGVPTAVGRVIPCDLFLDRHWPLVDLICGLVYVGYQLLLVLFAGFVFFFHERSLFDRLLRVYFLVHVMGFATYVLFPAAPPWYVEKFGLGPVNLQAASDPAGLARLDVLLGMPLAATMYGLSSNVFGAMPSLHMAMATLFPLFGRHLGKGWSIGGAGMAVLFAFGAVYFRHHYVLDLIVGITYTLIAAAIVEAVTSARSPHRPSDSGEPSPL